jgi:hypothetical protein
MAGNQRQYEVMAEEYIRRFTLKHGLVFKERLGRDLVVFEDIGVLYLRDIVWSMDNYKPVEFFEEYLKRDNRQESYFEYIKNREYGPT